MGRILRTAASHQDYREIWYYIALDNPDAADSVVREFDAALMLLSEHPEAGGERKRGGGMARRGDGFAAAA